MIFTLVKYWQPVAAAALTAWLAYGLHDLSMSFAERAKQNALDAQRAELTARCEADKQTTKEANDALQQSVTSITSRLAALKRLHPSGCVVPAPGLAQPAPGGAGHAGRDGAVAGSGDDFREYAARCESYRQQRIVLDRFGATLK